MRKVFMVDRNTYEREIQRLIISYRNWYVTIANTLYHTSYSPVNLIELDLLDQVNCLPPRGRTALAYFYDYPAGIGYLKEFHDQTAEIKYLFTRPEYRNQGFGWDLLSQLTQEAQQIGYTSIRVSCAKFMDTGLRLFKKQGFLEIEPYESAEITYDQQPNWIFLEKRLSN